MTVEPSFFSVKYMQSLEDKVQPLGCGGSSEAVQRSLNYLVSHEPQTFLNSTARSQNALCRCRLRHTGQQFAVKKLSSSCLAEFPYLLENEVMALRLTWENRTPNVVRLVEVLPSATGDTCLILE